MLEGRRGLSPLVSTLVLIAISVALGAVVMTWGESYISENAEFVQGAQEVTSSCQMARFSIINVGKLPSVCIQDNVVKIDIDNNAFVALYDISARVLGTDNVYYEPSLLKTPLEAGGSAKLSIIIQAPIGKIKQVKLTPKILISNQVVSCDINNVVIENLQACE